LADFKIKDVLTRDQLRKNNKKIRVMLPVCNFNINNNSNRVRASNLDRSSTSSNMSITSSSVAGSFQIDGLVIIENPTLISKSYDDKENDICLKDDYYLTIMGMRVLKFDISKISAQ